MYILFITIGLGFIYRFLFYFFPLFFNQDVKNKKTDFLSSFLIIAALSLIIYFAASYLPNEWWGNRLLHFMGGGFLPFLVCFLAAKNSGQQITRFQFLVFSMLVVMALGIGNEIIEFFLQHYFHLTFARTVDDTWLDLASNLLGTISGAALFTPFFTGKPIK